MGPLFLETALNKFNWWYRGIKKHKKFGIKFVYAKSFQLSALKLLDIPFHLSSVSRNADSNIISLNLIYFGMYLLDYFGHFTKPGAYW